MAYYPCASKNLPPTLMQTNSGKFNGPSTKRRHESGRRLAERKKDFSGRWGGEKERGEWRVKITKVHYISSVN